MSPVQRRRARRRRDEARSDRAKIRTRRVRDRSARSASRTHRARRHIARSRTSRTGSTRRDWNEERIVVQILSGLDTPRPGAPTGGTRRKLGESSITDAHHDIGPPNSLESTSSPRAARQIRCGNPPSYRAIWAPDRVCFFPDINNAAENARRANTNLVVRATGAAAMVMEAEAILSVLLTGVLYERRLATAVPCVVMGPSTLQTSQTSQLWRSPSKDRDPVRKRQSTGETAFHTEIAFQAMRDSRLSA